jgi:tetratricopeptide (TPR) repeat protein
MRVPQVVSQAKELRDKEGKLEEALELLKKYEKTSPKKDLPFVQYEIGLLLHDTGKFQESLRQFEEAVKTAREVNNLFIESDSLRRIGWGLWVIKNDDKRVKDYLDRAWNIVEGNLENQDFQRVGANIWAARGAVHYKAKEHSNALMAYGKAMDLAKESKFYQRVCTVNGDIANVYIDQKKYDEARKKLEEGYEDAKVNYRHSVPSSLIRLVRLYSLDDYEGKDFKKAEKLLEEALKVTQSEKWRRDEAEVYDGLYRLYLIQDDMKKADMNGKKAVEIYKELGMMDRVENLK